MKKTNRREFLGVLAAGASALVLPHSARAANSRIEILVDEISAEISPNIYGHFVEHLGAVVYDGIWVGENSKIPNYDGIRKSLVDALKKVQPGVIRYPGGCFADSYNWRDGIGERAKRPRKTNFWYGVAGKDVPLNSTARIEPNEFGTNEFVRFCKLTGGKPYLAGNLRSLPAQELNDWMEYCNSPAGTTSLADLREKGSAGSREPFGVEFWGVGNESWGCGGELTPDEYAQEFRRYTAAYQGYGTPIRFIGSGASSDDPNWTRGVFANLRAKSDSLFARRLHGWGIHHYSWNTSGGRTSDWNAGKGDALKFNTEEYYNLLAEGDQIEKLILQHWAIMGEYDKSHATKIAVDEWGAWHRPGTELKPAHLLGQQNTQRDALLAALSLDIFNRHADKVFMANIAQLVNCLQSLFLTDEDKFALTPTYHVFEMFVPHQNAKSVRAVFGALQFNYDRNGKSANLWSLNGSASIKGKTLTLTVTNPHLTEAQTTEIFLRGARINSAQARVLKANDVHAHNTFENPQAVAPRDEKVNFKNDTANFTFAPASVTRIQLNIA